MKSILLLLSFLFCFLANTQIYFSHPPGFYDWNFVLKVNADNGDTLRYTLDGTAPNANSPVCRDSIPMTVLDFISDTLIHINTSPRNISPRTDNYKANILSIASFSNGHPTSPIYKRAYFVGAKKKERYPNMAIVSIITNPSHFFDADSGIYVPGNRYNGHVNSGNYYQKGRNWERPIHFSYFDEEGLLQFEQEMGVRIHGRIRRIPQKSLRLCARSVYGAKEMNFPFFDSTQTHFKKLLLRNNMGCWQKTLFKDQLTTFICKDLNFETVKGKPVVVFINGEYWGVHALKEYFNDNHLAFKYNIPKDSINIVKHDYGHSKSISGGAIEEGSGAQLKILYSFLTTTNIQLSENYEFVKSKLDISSVIDYYCAELFFNNRDWPGNNNILWSNGTNGKWRQAFLDLDAGWIDPHTNTLKQLLTHSATGKPEASEYLFQKLLTNSEFRVAFATRMAELLNTTFSTNNLLAAIELYTTIYQPHMYDHTRRWSTPGTTGQWLKKVELLKQFAKDRPTHIRAHFKDEFGNDFSQD